LFGFENITNNNGWAIAAVGATIVFSGLVVLSFVISQIHKILKLWDEREKFIERFKKKAPPVVAETAEAPAYSERHLPSVDELASIYQPLVDQLEEPFKLSQLFEIAKKNDLPHPHLSIQRLQEDELLVSQGDGSFTWNKPKGK
jgi:hypothetical protein